MLESLSILLRSMAWTMPVLGFFLAIGLLLATMTVLEFAWPTAERRGFLPMRTTRGDRLFLGLLGSAWIHLFWLAFLAATPLWWGSILAAAWFLLVLRYG